jgi:hypothetical protein
MIEKLRKNGNRRLRCELCYLREKEKKKVVKNMKKRKSVGSKRIEKIENLSKEKEKEIFVMFKKEKGRGGSRGNGKDKNDVSSK